MLRSDPHGKVRRGAIQALGRMGPAAAQRLPLFFSDSDEALRHFAAETLGASGVQQAAAACAEQLTGTATVKCAVLLALGRMRLASWAPEAGERSSRKLKRKASRCLHDSELSVRLAAIQVGVPCALLGAASAERP